MTFELLASCPHTGARRGKLHTPHGSVETPAFMPVGTQASVKTMGSEDVEALGYELILANTYHLSLRPGSELIQRFGGLHKFMSWKGPILTDSGGYQVMSLAHMSRIDDEGVRFKSHLDGSEMFLTPERSIQIQAELGVDISMALDVCPPYPCTREEAARGDATDASVGAAEFGSPAKLHPPPPSSDTNHSEEGGSQAIFGIVQGGIYEDLRRESAEYIMSLPFDGFAIGGVSVGEPTEMQYPVVQLTAPLLPKDKPRYLMGVGHPKDILHAVAAGCDIFDCVLPTRMARHHALYTMRGRINIAAAEYAEVRDHSDQESLFLQTERYSAGYLRHLFKTGESLGPRLATLHNLAFYARLMREIREAIQQGSWAQLLERYANV